jgi:hypothetical protein
MMLKNTVCATPWLAMVLLAVMLAAPEARGQLAITVVTDPATSIGATGATLNGTVNGNGEDISAVYFDYGPAIPYDQSRSTSPRVKGRHRYPWSSQVSPAAPTTTFGLLPTT